MKNWLKLALIGALIALGGVLFFYGIPVSKVVGVYDIAPLKDTLSYGLDLTGGVYVVLEAEEEEEGTAVSEETLDKAVETIRNRIDSIGVKEPTITKQGDNRLRVSIPDVTDQQEALDLIGKTAELEFVSEEGEVLLTGADVESAIYEMQQVSYVEEPVVSLTFTSEGGEKFAEATKNNLNKTIEIRLDGEIISAPVVESEITDGKAVINGMADSEEAIELATLINAGSLPVQLEPIEIRSIGPTLGQDSLEKSVTAGIIGVSLVFVFMAIIYLLLGGVSVISLLIYIIIYMILMSLLEVTLTLPGIAGIILSVGMAVDANIIIFERIKDEIKSGKSILAAIDAGFSRATVTILDANITTIIAGLVLYFLGSGTIKGFALTLMVGVIVSMITAIFVTKKIIKLVAGIKGFDNKKLYGIRGGLNNEKN